MKKFAICFVMLTLVIAGCSSDQDGEQSVEDNEINDPVEMNESEDSIEIVLADAHKDQIHYDDIQKELEDIQAFFDEKDIPFHEGTVNFVILRGMYNHDEASMLVVGVFVNKTAKPINGLAGTLAFDLLEEEGAAFSQLDFEFDSAFLGKLQNNQGFPIHIQVPVDGLNGDQEVYQATEMTGEVKDVKVIFPE